MITTSLGWAMLVIAADPALAASFDDSDRWRQIARTSTGSVWYVDRPTQKIGRTTASAWLAMDHSRDRREAARQTRALIEIDCGAGRYQWIQYFSYRRDGSPMPERVEPNVQREVVPGSPVDGARQELCHRGD